MTVTMSPTEAPSTSIHIKFFAETIFDLLPPADWTIHHRHVEIYRWNSFNNNEALAQTLFAGLRDLDARHVTTILCPLPPGDGLGLAIRDRLEKAAKSK